MRDAARLAGKITVFASNAYAVDTTDQAAAGRAGQARSLMSRFGAAVAFTDPELVAIGFETLRRWMAQTPELAFMQHYLTAWRSARLTCAPARWSRCWRWPGTPFQPPRAPTAASPPQT